MFPSIAELLTLAPPILLALTFHEFAHAWTANKLGDPTARNAGRLTLNPLAHLDPIGTLMLFIVRFGWAKPVPYNPYNLKNQRWGEALVAVAGSATNILLAIIFGLIVRFGSTPLTTGGTLLDATTLSLAATIAFINLFLGFFNLIPFPPLDGFTTLRSALPWHLSSGLNRFEQQIRTMGTMSLILFLIVFSYIFAAPFFNFVVWLFGLITGSSI